MTKVIRINAGPPIGHNEIVSMVEDLLARARDGLVLGLALVEHRDCNGVFIEYCGPVSYHQLNSGAARLAHELAGKQPGE